MFCQETIVLYVVSSFRFGLLLITPLLLGLISRYQTDSMLSRREAIRLGTVYLSILQTHLLLGQSYSFCIVPYLHQSRDFASRVTWCSYIKISEITDSLTLLIIFLRVYASI